MAEPTYSTPAPGPTVHGPHAPAAGTPGSSPGANLAELFVQDLPELPSLAALHALTDRDLPSTDGLPMPESMFQDQTMGYTSFALRRFFKGRRPGVCVASDLLVYDDGRPATNGPVRPVWISPDIMVAMGVGDRMRDSYVIWREGKAPEFVMEVASKSTWKRDRDEKPALYAALGVVEYFLYDAQGGYLAPRLQGQVRGAAGAVAAGAAGERRVGAAQRGAGSVCVPEGTGAGAALARPGDGKGPGEPRRGPRRPGQTGRGSREGGRSPRGRRVPRSRRGRSPPGGGSRGRPAPGANREAEVRVE